MYAATEVRETERDWPSSLPCSHERTEVLLQPGARGAWLQNPAATTTNTCPYPNKRHGLRPKIVVIWAIKQAKIMHMFIYFIDNDNDNCYYDHLLSIHFPACENKYVYLAGKWKHCCIVRLAAVTMTTCLSQAATPGRSGSHFTRMEYD